MANVWLITMIEFEIDGQEVSAPEGSMIIEAADAHGIYIPRFCYHHKLSIVANCRMCLVEVSTARKPVPACATPVTQDMKVFTVSEAAMQSQRTVMEFLLINHPLDCPICDQGGECELQDLALGFGSGYSYFDQKKRAVASEDIGPLVETEMTRCIHCTRCVRFGEEIAGLRELGITFRGEDSGIGTYIKHFMRSELSGNIIDLCPVGALTAKPSRYSERAWTLKEKPSIAPHDCIGSNIYINTRSQEYAPQESVMRVNPRTNDSVNECWISDRDRFAYEGLSHKDRLLKPRMKKNGKWVDVEWKYALMAVADRLQAIVHDQSPDELAALVSPNSTVEECFLMQKLVRTLGSNNIDHRLRELDFSDQHLAPAGEHLGISLADLETVNAVLLIGSMVRGQQPLLAHRINKAFQEGAKVMAINPVDYQFTFGISHKIIDADIVTKTAEVAKALADLVGKNITALKNVTPSAEAKEIAATLKDSEKSYVMLGDIAVQHPHASYLRKLVRIMNDLIGCLIGMTTDGANSAGACLAGAVPHRAAAAKDLDKPGKDANSLLTSDPKRAYLLLNLEPEHDTANPESALKTLQDAGCVVCLTPFATPTMESYADFILPIAPFSETAGTFVNAEGQWQRFSAATVPHGDAKPAWKLIRVLANFLQLDDFDYQTSHEVHDEVKALVDNIPEYQGKPVELTELPKPPAKFMRIANPHMYRVDGLVRRAEALQKCMEVEDFAVCINQHTADAMGVKKDATTMELSQGDQKISLAVVIDNAIANGVVVLPSALNETAGFGMAFGEVNCI
jgi:NADH-quinone oxidoreductase subunit G